MPTTSTTVSRLELDHPDLGHDGGAGLHTKVRNAWTKIGDNMDSRFFTEDALANGASVDFDHNFKTAFGELRINLFTRNIGDGELTRIESGGSPDLDDFTIAATPGSLTTQVRITNNTGGPVDIAAVVVHGKGAEVINDLEDVDTVTTPPANGQTLVWDGTNFVPGAGASGGEVNFIDNGRAEFNTDGWATYADAAGATPVDGTGGSPTVTFTRQSSVVLRETNSFKITKDAANRQGEGASYDFTIGEQDTSRKCKLQFDFKTNEDAAYESGDLTVYIYDVTNATLITPVDTDINDTVGIFQTSFLTTNSTSYRLIFHIATTNASAWDAYIDNVEAGPGMTSQGAAIGIATAFTPAFTWTNVNELSGFYTREGENATLHFSFNSTGAQTGNFAVTMPSGLTIDSSKLASSSGTFNKLITVGEVFVYDNSAAAYYTGLLVWDSTNGVRAVRNNSLFNATNPITWANGDKMSGRFTVPITEWAGQGTIPMLAEDNLSSPTTWTPTGSWSTNTSYTGKYTRVGNRGIYDVQVTLSGAPDAVALDIDLPPGQTIDTSVINSNQFRTTLGYGTIRDDSAGTHYGCQVVMGATDGEVSLLFESAADSSQSTVSNTSPITFAANDTVFLHFEVPVVEFAGSQNSLVGHTLAKGSLPGLMRLEWGGFTKFVGGSHPDAYATLEDAMAAAVAGDCILVSESYTISLAETIDVADILIVFKPGVKITVDTAIATGALLVSAARVSILGARYEADLTGTLGSFIQITAAGDDCNISRAFLESNDAGTTVTQALDILSGASRNEVRASILATLGTISAAFTDAGTDNDISIRG